VVLLLLFLNPRKNAGRKKLLLLSYYYYYYGKPYSLTHLVSYQYSNVLCRGVPSHRIISVIGVGILYIVNELLLFLVTDFQEQRGG